MTKQPTPSFRFAGENIDKLHKEITAAIVQFGNDRTFGYENKPAKDTCMTIHIWGNAVKRLMNGSAPKGFIFNGKKLKEFQQLSVSDDPNPFNHVYTYPQMLRQYPMPDGTLLDQLESIKERLSNNVLEDKFDNGLVGIVYYPGFHQSPEKMCWQWVQVYYLGDGKVSLRLLFRSHDYGVAMWANLSFILYMMRQFVTRDCNCEIVEVILFSASAHIYETDQDAAFKTSGIEWKRNLTFKEKVKSWLN
jgi:thymidylate synthase